MKKRFNITGSCNPDRHYMVNSPQRFEAIVGLIDNGDYFTINRARQYGKTTMLNKIWRSLSDHYLVIPLSFEGLGDEAFASSAAFVTTFKRQMARHTASSCQDEELTSVWQDNNANTLDELALLITSFCNASKKTCCSND